MDVRELIAKVNQMNIHPTCSFRRWAIAFHINYSDVHIAFDEPNMDVDGLLNDTTHNRRQSNTLDHTHSRTHLFAFNGCRWPTPTPAHEKGFHLLSTLLLLCRLFTPPARANVLVWPLSQVIAIGRRKIPIDHTMKSCRIFLLSLFADDFEIIPGYLL